MAIFMLKIRQSKLSAARNFRYLNNEIYNTLAKSNALIKPYCTTRIHNVTYVNNKQIVVTGLKDMVILVVIFNICITRMFVRKEVTKKLRFQKTVEFFNYILEELED